ncbi:DNA-binding response OmpR family regulator [Fontibacillus solani]|uniref:DNA-binding response OmpR family regulator n=1 Tax=Fontibacillus solani TaxID=1572857 RepID=A0A7W3XQW6_9BACL|nr:response regulator transcription factor [Fontibacillus solani]MBA9084875.1 DNA-binding response OmpR family regulator [Fontibacillus solani]
MRILLVEDEQRLSDALVYILNKHNILVDVASDGITGQDMAETDIYDVIVLDRMLPGKEGIDILRHLRANRITTPIIFLTAKDAVESRVEGLEAGADDYLVKPFSTEEFIARVRALGRRSTNKFIGDQLRIASLTFDPLRCEVICGNTLIKLTLKEAQLLELFMRNHGQVLTREQILERVWGLESNVEMNSVDIYIFYLRKKLIQDGGVTIHTIRGVGYCLKEETHASKS